MGESQSRSSDQQFVENFKKNYVLVQSNLEDVRFGRISLYKTNEDSFVAVKRSYTGSRDDQDQFISSHLQPLQSQIQSPYLLRVYGFETHEEQAMCGSSNEVETYHEYYVNNLEAELEQRARSQIFYSEPEMWVILYSLVSAMAFLEKYGRCVGDVRPAHVQLTQQGQIKLTAFQTFPEDTLGFQKVLSYGQTGCLLAPEMMEDLRRKSLRSSSLNRTSKQQISYLCKGDVFSAAMTVLHCATLSNVLQCYSFESYQIDYNLMNQFLQDARQRYSKFFCNMLKAMLEVDPEVRPLPSAVHSALLPYEADILNLQPFFPNYDTIKQSLSSSQDQAMLFQSVGNNSSSAATSSFQQQQQVQQQQAQQQQVQQQQVQYVQTAQTQQLQQQQQQQTAMIQQQVPQLQAQQQVVQATQSIPVQQQQSMQYVKQYTSATQIQNPPLQASTQFVQQQPSPNRVQTYYVQSPEKMIATQPTANPILQTQQSPVRLIQTQAQSNQYVQQQPQPVQYIQPKPIQYTSTMEGPSKQIQYTPAAMTMAPSYGATTTTYSPNTQYSPKTNTRQVQYFPQSQIVQKTVLPAGLVQNTSNPSALYPQSSLQTANYHSQQGNLQDLSDIDRRINEVLQRTRDTLDKVEQSEVQNI